MSGPLPYMVKLLAAAAPLPCRHTRPRCRRPGGSRRRPSRRPVGSAERIYVDPYAKPEVLIALGPFRALCGIRPVEATCDLLRRIGGPAERMADRLATDGVMAVVGDHLVDRKPTFALVEACVGVAATSTRPPGARPRTTSPGDPAVALSLLLNLVTLRAGQGLYLTPGNLHAYLEGTGVEVMGSSDNVVRGGLTNKRVAVDELVEVFDPTPLADPDREARKVRDGLWRYDTPGAPFTVYAEHVAGDVTVHARGREIVLCGLGETDVLRAGEAAYLAPGGGLTLSGTATLFRTTDA